MSSSVQDKFDDITAQVPYVIAPLHCLILGCLWTLVIGIQIKSWTSPALAVLHLSPFLMALNLLSLHRSFLLRAPTFHIQTKASGNVR